MVSILMLAMLGCGGKGYSASLLSIDSLLGTDPDSAYVELCDYDTVKLSVPDRHLYTLLMAEARDKTYHDDTVVKSLSEAADFFIEHGDRRNAMRSLFYKGRAYQNAGNYSPAIISFLNSVELADTSEHLYRGKIFNAISETYKKVSDAPRELVYGRYALEEYQKLDSLVFINYTHLTCGYALCRSNNLEEGIKEMLEVYKTAKNLKNEDLTRDALMFMALGYLWNSEDQKANDCLHLLLSKNNEYPVHPDYMELYINTMISIGSPIDSIAEMAKLLINSDNGRELPHNYYAYMDNFKRAYECLLEESQQDNNLIANIESSIVGREVDIYLQNKHAESEAKRASLRNMIIWMVVCGVLCFLLLISIMRINIINKRKKEKELLYSLELLVKEKTEITGLIDKFQTEAALLSIDKEKLLQDNYRLRNDKANELMHEFYLIENIFKDINNLHSEFYTYGNSDKVRGNLLSRLSEQIKFLKEDEAILIAMEGHINNIHSEVLNDINKHVTFTKDQRRIIAFHCLGFSKEAICQIMGLSIDNYHSRLYRIKNRIAGCGSPRRDELLDLIYTDHA